MAHCRDNKLDPLAMPGSVYGAVGIPQFMPSNLPLYAVDGNKDGKIDLFNPADAIPSVGNYLKRHGWDKSEAKTRHALKRYNNSTMYANTIMVLAEAVTAPKAKLAEIIERQGKPKASAVAKAKPGKKKSTVKAAGKRAPATPAAKKNRTTANTPRQ